MFCHRHVISGKKNLENLQRLTDRVVKVNEQFGLILNVNKIRAMVISWMQQQGNLVTKEEAEQKFQKHNCLAKLGKQQDIVMVR